MNLNETVKRLIRLERYAFGRASDAKHPAGEGEWNDLRVPFNSVKVGATFPPSFTQWLDDGAGSTGLYGWEFSASQLQQVFFDAQLPHAYREGSRIAPHCHFLTTATPVVGETVRFGLEFTYANVFDVFPQTSTIYAEYTFDGEDAAFRQCIGGFDPDIEDAGIEVSAMLSCRFFRDAAHVNDTFGGTVHVLEFDFHYLVESFGSNGEFAKT